MMPDIKDAFSRFPIPFICIIAACLISLLTLHDVRFIGRDLFPRLLVNLTYGAVALTSLKLLVESKNWSPARHLVAAVVVMTIVVIYAWFIIDKNVFSTSVYFASALILSMLFAPYLNKRSDQASVWYFNYQTGVAVFFAGLASLVLAVGLIIILASLHYLFDIKIASNVYGDIWILSWGGLFPIYVLANISRQFDYEAESCSFPKGIQFITNYILLPLMVVYMAILYAYFVRITIQWQLPRGKLTWMIAVFGSLGIVTKLLAYPIRNSGTRLLLWFDKYYYYALIVPIILLAIAIGVRIRDYGVTEQRYTVVLMAVWFSSIVLLAIYKRDRFHIKYVPMILAVLLLLGSYGPWSTAEVSLRSQVSRLASLSSEYRLVRDGQLVKAKTDMPFAARKKLSSIIDYLCQSERRFERVRPWFKTLLQEAGKKETTPCMMIGGKRLVELMGVEYVYRWRTHADQNQNDHFNYDSHVLQTNKTLLGVSGYDYVGRGTLYLYAKNWKYTLNYNYKGKNKTVTVLRNGEQVTISTEDGDKATFDIGGVIRELRKQHVATIKPADRDNLSLTASSANGRFKARLLLEQIRGSISAQQEIKINFIQYLLMLKFNAS